MLPASIPGIATGSILALSRGLGETAPLLLVGALTYVSFNPTIMGDFTALPVQIYQWIARPQEEFRTLAAAGIIVLLAILLSLNAFAIWLRNKYEKVVISSRRKWALSSEVASMLIITPLELPRRGSPEHVMADVSVNLAEQVRELPPRSHATSSSTSTTSVSRTRGTRLQEVSLEIYKNFVTAFIGPSGCGKSTFIRCFNRMNDLIPTASVEGTILYHGEDLYGPDVDPVEVRKRIGMVFQKPNPFPKSIYDNVAFGPRVLGMTDGLDDRVEKASSRRLSGTRSKTGSRRALSLSGGQQQRLCIAAVSRSSQR